VHSLAVNANGVYWANQGGATLLLEPLAGGPPVSLLPPTTPKHLNYYPYSLCIDATNLYFTSDSGEVYQLPLDGTAPITPALLVGPDGSNIRSNIATDSQWIYWVEYDAGTLKKVPVGGGSVVTLATGQNNAVGLAVFAGTVYWTIYANPGAVMSMPADGSAAPRVIAANQLNPLDVRVDATWVYWTTSAYGLPPQTTLPSGVLRTLR
jgi:hypothetical protein